MCVCVCVCVCAFMHVLIIKAVNIIELKGIWVKGKKTVQRAQKMCFIYKISSRGVNVSLFTLTVNENLYLIQKWSDL